MAAALVAGLLATPTVWAQTPIVAPYCNDFETGVEGGGGSFGVKKSLPLRLASWIASVRGGKSSRWLVHRATRTARCVRRRAAASVELRDPDILAEAHQF